MLAITNALCSLGGAGRHEDAVQDRVHRARLDSSSTIGSTARGQHTSP